MNSILNLMTEKVITELILRMPVLNNLLNFTINKNWTCRCGKSMPLKTQHYNHPLLDFIFSNNNDLKIYTINNINERL